MDWDSYYEKFYDWATSTQIKKMSSLTSFGASAEVSEVAQEYMDEKAASRLIKKAVAYGVQFTPDEIYDLSGCCDISAMNELLKSAKCTFTQEQLEDLWGSALFVSMGTWLQTYQASKSLPGQVLLTGFHLRLTAAVPNRTPLQSAGVQLDGPAAITSAVPDHIAVFPFPGRFRYCQLSNTEADPNFGLHSFFLPFKPDRHTALPAHGTSEQGQIPISAFHCLNRGWQ